MTTQEYDTDPSTPGAKRLSDPRSEVAEALQDTESSSPEDRAVLTPRTRPTTDPGIAPPALPLPVPVEPMGIVVPPVARVPNDSVDALLEGIRREQPERAGTPQAGQTGGETAVAYHGEHALRPAQVALQEPKVVIERPQRAQTAGILGRGSQVSLADTGVRDATVVTSIGPRRSVLGRMAIAVLAGVGVVMLIFLLLQRISSQVATAGGMAEPPATGVVPRSVSVPEPAAVPAAPVAETSLLPKSNAESQPAPSATVAAASSAVRKPTSATKPNKPKAKPTASATKTTVEDLGEFKTAL